MPEFDVTVYINFFVVPKFKINIMGIDEIKNKLEDKVKEFKEKFDEK